jgi:RHS repeat-associated protein
MLQDISALPAFEPDAPQQRDPERTPHCLEWRAHYDALGRRLWTEWTTPDGEMRRRDFYWDGDRLAAEILPSGKLRIYQYGSADALSPLQFTEYGSVGAAPESGETYHLFYDASGQALSIENGGGVEVWRAERVDPYGLHELRGRHQLDPSGRGTTLEYNLRWPGHYLDPETGLHYNRYRYYDPRLGRYLQSDPIGYEGSPVNLYAYCANPLVQVDVLGLDHDNTTSKSDSSEPDAANGKKEGTAKAPAAAPSPPPHHVLAASSGNTRAQRAARARVVLEFYGSRPGLGRDRAKQDMGYGGSPPRLNGNPKGYGIDLSQPVRVQNIPPPDQMTQFVKKHGHPGNFFDPIGGQSPDQLGLNGDPALRQPKVFNVPATNPPQQGLVSGNGPVIDDWTDPTNHVSTKGGGTQMTVDNITKGSVGPQPQPW